MKLEAHPEESSSRTRGTSTSCIMRIQRSVAHTCNGLRPGAAKSEIWQAEGGGGWRAGRTIFRSDHDAQTGTPANYGKT